MQFPKKNRSIIALALIQALLLHCAAGTASGAAKVHVINVHFESEGNIIKVHYDLLGPGDATASVGMVLKRESDHNLLYTPKNVEGDIGDKIPTGSDKIISWKLESEFPEGLQGNDYYFEINVENVSASEGLPWFSIGAGVLAGAAVIWFVANSSSSNQSINNSGASFPMPPGRP